MDEWWSRLEQRGHLFRSRWSSREEPERKEETRHRGGGGRKTVTETIKKKKKKSFINTQDIALSSLLCIAGHMLAPHLAHLPIGNGPLSMMILVWRQSDIWSVSNPPFLATLGMLLWMALSTTHISATYQLGYAGWMDGWSSTEPGEWIWVTLVVPWHFILCHQNVLSVNIFKHVVELPKTFDRRHRRRFKKLQLHLLKTVSQSANKGSDASASG